LNDTPPEVKQMVRDRLMALSGEERFCMGSRMFDTAKRMVPASSPDGLRETERKRRLLQRICGEAFPETQRLPTRWDQFLRLVFFFGR
jgi:hypothetical protein